jgi:hypothetical protein
MAQRRRLSCAEAIAAVLDSTVLTIACLVTYWLCA